MITFYVDIETRPSNTPPSRDEISVPSNYKKQETIDKYIDDHLYEAHHKQALNSMKGEIICIGVAANDDDPIVFDSLVEFDTFVCSAMTVDIACEWVGHNIADFDAKWLVRHGVRDGCIFQKYFGFDRYRGNIVDTQNLWACGDYHDHVKLNDLAKFLGVGQKTDGIDGSKVWGYWKDGRIEEIKEYCAQDVKLTRAIYQKLRGQIIF